MPALPGAHLIRIHSHRAFASFETRFNTGTRFDDSRQFPKRGLLECHPTSIRRREVIMVAIAGVLIGGIARGPGLQHPVVRQGTAGNDQPLLGSGAFALNPRLHPACDHLDLHQAFLTVSHCHAPPGCRMERLAPNRPIRFPGPPTHPALLWQGRLKFLLGTSVDHPHLSNPP